MNMQTIYEILLKEKSLPDELKTESEEVWQRLLQELIDLKGQACLEQIVRYLKPNASFQTVGQARWERFLARTMLSVQGMPTDVFEHMAVRYLEAGLHLAENSGAFLADDEAEAEFFSRLYEAKQLEVVYEDSKTKDKLEKIKAFFPHVAKIVEIGEANGMFCSGKKKIAFFVKPGMDSFLGDIIDSLKDDYSVRKYVVVETVQIDEGMQWADICWFEWCDELIDYASKLSIASRKRIICRIHGYEVYTDNIITPKWENIDQIIIVTPHIFRMFAEKVNRERLKNTKIDLIYCGINLKRYPFVKHNHGFNIGYLGYINFKKNIPLTLDIFYELYKKDQRYKLYIAGNFQDERTYQYFYFFIKEHKLEKNVFFEGWKNDEDKIEWFKKINYMLVSSIDEGLCYAAAEAMVSGIMPVLHLCEGLKDHYDAKYLFSAMNEACDMITSSQYNSEEYREYIEKNFSLQKQMNKVREVLEESIKISRKNFIMREEDLYSLEIKAMIEMFEKFNPYHVQYINNYCFEDTNIQIGKIEKMNEDFCVIEFIISNKKKERLAMQGILYNVIRNELILPKYIAESKYKFVIINLVKEILQHNINRKENMVGFIYDNDILQDIKENSLAYSWERAIPASQFMPNLALWQIAERYFLAQKYISQQDRVLEAACGFGYGAAYLARVAQEVVALDLAEENILFGKAVYNFPNLQWIQGDVTQLPFADNTFDVYTSFETFEHLPVEIIELYLNEAKRVLKNSGIMILSTPNREMRRNVNNPFHVKEYSFDEWNSILKLFFKDIIYYSQVGSGIQEGINRKANNMIAICFC